MVSFHTTKSRFCYSSWTLNPNLMSAGTLYHSHRRHHSLVPKCYQLLVLFIFWRWYYTIWCMNFRQLLDAWSSSHMRYEQRKEHDLLQSCLEVKPAATLDTSRIYIFFFKHWLILWTGSTFKCGPSSKTHFSCVSAGFELQILAFPSRIASLRKANLCRWKLILPGQPTAISFP